jgi:PIN domain nuclease of toxin-antitoxin system
MTPRLLLDTHILLRWLGDTKRLSQEQRRVLEQAAARGESLGLSAMTLLKISLLTEDGRLKLTTGTGELFATLQDNPLIQILPITFEVALEAGSLRVLGDPADRAIVATARVHGMQLLTSDEGILRSGLARTIA